MTDRPIALVARREIREATRARSFRISVVLSAVALAAIIVIAHLAAGDDEKSVDIVVAGPDAAAEASRIEPLGTSVGIRFDVTTAPDDDAATAAVRADEADVAVLTDGAALATEDPVDLSDDSTLATAVNVLRADIALENGLEAVGLEPDQAAQVQGDRTAAGRVVAAR